MAAAIASVPLNWPPVAQGDVDFSHFDPYTPLKPLLDKLPRSKWPETSHWSELSATRGLKTLSGAALRFVEPSEPALSALDFERKIYATGAVETRELWHDAFHACTWLTFPRTKAQLNALHVQDGLAASPNRRSALRNLVTLFDEGGLIVASNDETLLDLIRHFQWRELFVTRRAEVLKQLDFVVFGHALYERLLNLHYGATGRGLLLHVPESYFSLTMLARIEMLEERLCAWFLAASSAASTALLHPVPLKGVPGWARENHNPAYYDDVAQFRPGRRNRPATTTA